MAEAVAVHGIAKAKKASSAPLHASIDQSEATSNESTMLQLLEICLLGTEQHPQCRRAKLVCRTVGDADCYINCPKLAFKHVHFLHIAMTTDSFQTYLQQH
jgi:hypothetical protein